ncbi:MAG: helix-turn-helix domain-containing protein [archaeon]
MGRHKGPDQAKIKKIRKSLEGAKEGLWAMEISRKTKISKSTVQRYLTTYMKDEVDEIRSFSELVKLYKLR